MTLNQPVNRIAIVGTGVIGASWAAYYLARGIDVVASGSRRADADVVVATRLGKSIRHVVAAAEYL